MGSSSPGPCLGSSDIAGDGDGAIGVILHRERRIAKVNSATAPPPIATTTLDRSSIDQ